MSCMKRKRDSGICKITLICGNSPQCQTPYPIGEIGLPGVASLERPKQAKFPS